MDLVCFQGDDKESLGQINALIKRGNWEKMLIIKNKSSEEIDFGESVIKINVDSGKSLIELKTEMLEKIKNKIGNDFEVALSIASGNGKEHMALISALLSIPVGIKLAAFTKKGVEFVN